MIYYGHIMVVPEEIDNSSKLIIVIIGFQYLFQLLPGIVAQYLRGCKYLLLPIKINRWYESDQGYSIVLGQDSI